MEDYSKPVLPGTAASDYERYLRTDELLKLQKTSDEAVHHDELLFQVVHQSSELWLKLACADVELAIARVNADEVAAAVRLLRRATQSIILITTQIHMLEHMSPWEYQTIRRVLGHGSGFDSPGFNRVHSITPHLGEAFTAILKRRHLDLVTLYQKGREFEDLYQLAEQLIEWDERITLWKYHHLKLVERVIGGHVVGTQGTPVEVLGKRVGVLYFPQLWDVRNKLTALAKEEEGTAGAGLKA
jgi:tryptophan 2,3-dioxygenase